MFNKILIILVFLYVVVGFFHPITSMTQDLGRHLLIGKIVIKTHAVPKINLLSYTHPDSTFINHHWLSEVFYFLIVKQAGFNGLLLFSTLIAMFAFSFPFLYCLRRYKTFSVIVSCMILLPILFGRTDIRPEIFSFFFASLFITILYRYQEKYTRFIFLLPLLELFWVNMHIYFIVGIAIVGLFFADEILTQRKEIIKGFKKLHVPQSTTSLFVTLLLCIFATFFNPSAVQGAMYPFHVFQNYGYTIVENQTLFFLWNYMDKKIILYYFSICTFILFSLFLTFKKQRPIDWLLILFFTILGILAIRNDPLIVFTAIIPFAKSLSAIQTALLKNSSFRFNGWNILPILLSLLIAWNIQQTISVHGVGFGLEKGGSGALDFFEKNHLKGPIFNNFDIGSFIAYRLYPQEKVFVDGRPEAYPESFFREIYKSMQLNHNVFKTHEEKYKFNTIIFSHTDQTEWGIIFLTHIVNDPSWKLVYLDDYVVILVKNNQQNENIIKKYEVDKQSLKLNMTSYDLNALLRLGRFFQNVAWNQEEMEVYQELLSRNPSSCLALYQLARIALQTNNPTSSVYISRYNTLCQ